MEVDEVQLMKKMGSSGVITINLGNNQICEHSLIAYLDRNLSVRDCFITDFQLELPEIDTVKVIKQQQIPKTDTIDVDLIKNNVFPLSLTFIIRGCFFNSKILLLSSNRDLNSHLHNFFDFIFKNIFDINILIVSKEVYLKNKKNMKIT